MFLRVKIRRKDGKEHRYWSVVENRRVRGGRVVQRQVLYLGELNDEQQDGWVRTIEALEEKDPKARRVCHQLALFPDDRPSPAELACEVAQVRIKAIALRNARQWGACWLAMYLWDLLEFDAFWRARLKPSRKGTDWLNVLKALVAYRLIDPGSEWRFHRQWFDKSAMADLLGEDFSIAQKDKPYRCLDQLLAHKEALFDHLRERWGTLFGARFDVLLFDLTSTYFESDPPPPGSDDKRRFGYSRDHRSDCVQVCIALVVTPEGLPLAYEVYPGNTHDTATLREFLARIEKRFGKARRIWLMDRGIPTEETLAEMRAADTRYLVGTPKGGLSKFEKRLLEQAWKKARDNVRVKFLEDQGEFYIYVESHDRVAKERSMRRRRLKRLWATLNELRTRKRIDRDGLLMSLGVAKKEAGRAWNLVTIQTPKENEPVNEQTFTFALDREKLRLAIGREGRNLLRSNMTAEAPETVWEMYLLLVWIEQVFKELKGDLAVRPIFHQLMPRVEAHIFVSFLAYCLHTTLRNLARDHAAGLTTRAILDKMATIEMIDVDLPITDGKHILLRRFTDPDPDATLVLEQLKLKLPAQPNPRITAEKAKEV